MSKALLALLLVSGCAVDPRPTEPRSEGVMAIAEGICALSVSCCASTDSACHIAADSCVATEYAKWCGPDGTWCDGRTVEPDAVNECLAELSYANCEPADFPKHCVDVLVPQGGA